jgi:glycyl-tRNA synthetase beta chain
MVGEFPELQGIMGEYYARHDGEAEAVAVALREQYLPRFWGDQLPETALGQALSLAEKIDTLCGIFGIGQARLQAIKTRLLYVVRHYRYFKNSH